MTKPMTRTIAAASISALLLAVAAGVYTTYAHPGADLSPEMRAERQEQHEVVQEAIENNDFEAWGSLLADHPKAAEFATQERFNILVQAHNLKEAGDFEGARELLKENDIQMRRHGKQKGSFNPEKRDEMTAIFESNDYEAWSTLMSDHPKAEDFITEENFNLLSQAHQLRVAGDEEGARELLKESGIKKPGQGFRMHNRSGR